MTAPAHTLTSGHLHAALRLLGEYTGGRFDFWALAGPHAAPRRAEIASALAGRRIPQSKAGVIRLRESFYAISTPAGDCIAAREASFVAWAKAVLS